MEPTTRTTLGIPGNGPNGSDNSPDSSGQIAISSNVFSAPLIGYSVSLPWLRAESNIDFANNWTKIIGNHTLKVGRRHPPCPRRSSARK